MSVTPALQKVIQCQLLLKQLSDEEYNTFISRLVQKIGRAEMNILLLSSFIHRGLNCRIDDIDAAIAVAQDIIVNRTNERAAPANTNTGSEISTLTVTSGLESLPATMIHSIVENLSQSDYYHVGAGQHGLFRRDYRKARH